MSVELLTRPDRNAREYLFLEEQTQKERKNYWRKRASTEGSTVFDGQQKAWNDSVSAWITHNTGAKAADRDEFISTLSAVGIKVDKEDIQKDLSKKVDAFYTVYLEDKSGLKQFIEDITKEKNRKVDTETLEKRLSLVEGLLVSFGNTDNIPDQIKQQARKMPGLRQAPQLPQAPQPPQTLRAIDRRKNTAASVGAAFLAGSLVFSQLNLEREKEQPDIAEIDELKGSRLMKMLKKKAENDAREIREGSVALEEVGKKKYQVGPISRKRANDDLYASTFFGYSSEEQVEAGKLDTEDNHIFKYEDQIIECNKPGKELYGKDCEKAVKWFSAGAGPKGKAQFRINELILVTNSDGKQLVLRAADEGPALRVQRRDNEAKFDMSWDAYDYLGEPGKVKAEPLPKWLRKWVKPGPLEPQIKAIVEKDVKISPNMVLLEQAKDEVEKGYAEKDNGYSKYGDWYHKNVVKARKQGDWYQKNHIGNYKFGNWCDMFLSYSAEKAGVERYAGQFALTTDHAKWFKKNDAWGDTPKPGSLVFFDWQGSKSIKEIDHVGIVEKVDENGDIHTIEGNTEDKLLRKVRSQDKVVGYGDPSAVKVG